MSCVCTLDISDLKLRSKLTCMNFTVTIIHNAIGDIPCKRMFSLCTAMMLLSIAQNQVCE